MRIRRGLSDFNVFLSFFFPLASKSSKLSTKSRSRGFAVLQFFEIVDEIKVRKLRGAPDPRKCRRNRGSEASRSSRSSKLSTKSKFRGLAELQVIEKVDDIELRRPRGAPSRALNADTGARWGALASTSEESRSSRSSKNLDEINVRKLRGISGRELHADTRARWGASAPHRASSIYMYVHTRVPS